MIPEIAPYNNYCGNNSTNRFDFDFYIEKGSQLKVVFTDANGNSSLLKEGTDYSIAETGSRSGSYITFPLVNSSHGLLQNNEVISLQLTLPIEQTSEYGKSSDLDLYSLEYSLDYITRICQIMKRELERSVKVQEGSNIDTDILTQNINSIVENVEQVKTVASHIQQVSTTSYHIFNVDTVAEHIDNVDTVSGHINKVDTVANHIAKVDNVSDHINNVDTVSEHIANVDNCAINMAAIIDAPHQAQIAIDNAETATEQAGIATQKADAAIIALANAEALKNALALFSTVDCGTLSDTRNIIYDAGTLNDMYVNYIDCGSAADKYISDNDITNMLNIPVLQKQADATDEALNAATKRIAKNENDIAALQNGLAGTNENLTAEIDKIDNNVAGAVGRIETNEDNIAALQQGLLNTNIDLSDAEDRIEQNKKDILELQKISGVFSYVDCGSLSDVREVIYDAGTLNNAATNYIDCSNLNKFFLCLDDLRNVCTIPNLLNAVADLSAKLTDALGRITELENGIDCGVLRYVR